MLDSDTHILIVDDHGMMRAIIRDLLCLLGYRNLSMARDGVQALEVLHQRRIELVISDWKMAPVSGLELLRRMRTDAALEAIPFIMVTANSRNTQVLEAQQAGASNFIVKPFNQATLHRKIELVMGCDDSNADQPPARADEAAR